MQWTAVCLTLLVACVGAVYGNCVGNMYNEVLQCFSDQGLDFLVEAGQQDANKLMREAQSIDPRIQCQQIDLYKNAIGCAMGSLRRCLSLSGMGGALPDTDSFRRGMDVLCQKYDKFDYQCLRDNYYDILTCGQNTIQKVVRNPDEANEEMNIDDVICISADINYDCSKYYLQNCGNSTLVIYLEQLDKYQVPSACTGKRPGRGRISYVSASSATSATSISAHAFSAVLVSMATLVGLRFARDKPE